MARAEALEFFPTLQIPQLDGRVPTAREREAVVRREGHALSNPHFPLESWQCLPRSQIPHPNAGIIFLPAPVIAPTGENKATVMRGGNAVNIRQMPLETLQLSPRYGIP